MRADRKKSILFSKGFILSTILLISSVFIFTGCISMPGGYQQGPVGGNQSGQMHRQQGQNVYIMDQTSSYRGGQFTIRNQNGQTIIRVKGDLYSRGRRLSLTDNRGREIYYITQSGSGYNRSYRIYSRGRLAAKVYKKRTRNRETFYVKSKQGRDYTIQGNFMRRLYAFFYKRQQVAEVTKSSRQFGDKYRIKISPYQDSLLILAATVVIDMDSIYPGR